MSTIRPVCSESSTSTDRRATSVDSSSDPGGWNPALVAEGGPGPHVPTVFPFAVCVVTLAVHMGLAMWNRGWFG